MSKKIYSVSYFELDKEGRRSLIGRAVVDDANTNDSTYPFMRKCFLHAPEKARHASVVTFEQIKTYQGGRK